MEQNEILFYGTTWCGMCQRRRGLLDQHQIPYRWIDIDQDVEAARFVEQVNHGFRSVPTIVFPDGTILVEPSEERLRQALRIE